MKIFIYLIIALAIMSCSKDEATPQISDNITEISGTIIGQKLENPYSVANMKIAYDSITSSSDISTLSSVSISTTDYYVRFHIESNEQLEELDADSLELFAYPLDYKIEEYGDDYDEIDSTGGKWMYTSVPVNYEFRSDIDYEILEDLYLPESVETTGLATSSICSFLNKLEDKSLELTGNAEESDSSKISTLSKKKYPKGYVTVFNSQYGATDKYIPVVGIKIRTRHWFKYAHTYTNSAGYYSISTGYRNNPTYIFLFENKAGFQLREHLTSIARARESMGSHSKSGYNFVITRSSDIFTLCTVNNAVIDYFDYCDSLGIGSPDNDLRIAVLDKDGNGATPMLNHVSSSKLTSTYIGNFFNAVANLTLTSTVIKTVLKVFAPDVVLKAEKGSSGTGTAEIYLQTFHELTHAAHYNKVGDDFWVKYIKYISSNGDKEHPYGDGTATNAGLCALSEAWAYNMGYYLTLQRFGEENDAVYADAFEKFTPKETGDSDDDIYIPEGGLTTSWYGWIPAGIMNDLVDSNVDQYRTGFNDNVAGYTYKELYNALDKDVTTPQEFMDRLLEENSNLDKTDVEDLFDGYYWK